MTSLTYYQIGSVINNIIQNVPASISGLMPTLVGQAVYFAEVFTGNTIGESVDNAYQPAIINLTTANVLSLMESQGIGTKEVRIGELAIAKGLRESSSQGFKNLGMEQLNQIGQHVSYYQCWD